MEFRGCGFDLKMSDSENYGIYLENEVKYFWFFVTEILFSILSEIISNVFMAKLGIKLDFFVKVCLPKLSSFLNEKRKNFWKENSAECVIREHFNWCYYRQT